MTSPAHRVVLVAGTLDHAAADRADARLLLLDAEGHEPVELHLRCPDGDLDAAATLADAVETGRVMVRVVAGSVGGAAVGVLAAADERVATTSCLITSTERPACDDTASGQPR